MGEEGGATGQAKEAGRASPAHAKRKAGRRGRITSESLQVGAGQATEEAEVGERARKDEEKNNERNDCHHLQSLYEGEGDRPEADRVPR